MTYTVEQLNNREEKVTTNRKARTILNLLFCFLVSFLLSGLNVNDSCICLATAFVAASRAGLSGVFALVGGFLGYSFFFGFDAASIYIASSVVIYTVSFVFQYSVLYQKRFFEPISVALTLGISFAFGLVSTIRVEQSLYFFILTESIFGALMTYVYEETIFRSKDNRVDFDYHHIMCLLLCMGSIVLSLERYILFNCVSVGKIVYIISLLIMICSFDSLVVCLYAVLFTVGGQEQQHLIIALFVFCSVFFNFKTKITSSTCLFVIMLLFVLTDPAKQIALFYNVIAAIFIFLIIPRRWICFAKDLFGNERINRMRRSPVYSNENIINMSEILAEVLEILRLSRKNLLQRDNIDVFKEATEYVCSSCVRKEVCWENHHSQLLDMFFKMEKNIELRGRAELDDYSEWFREYCPSYADMLDEINILLRKNANEKYREVGMQCVYDLMCDMISVIANMSNDDRGRCEIDKNAVILENRICNYLSSINCDCDVFVSYFGDHRKKIVINGSKVYEFLRRDEVLNELSSIANIRLRVMNDPHKKNEVLLYEAEPYAVSVGVAAKKKKGEKICGDCCSYFKTEFGRFYLILSDGMGTGEHAFEQSSFVIEILERLLINGIMPNNAVQLTNLIVSVNNPEELDCATVDLFCLDLYSGSAEIFKLGAAPSYLLNDDVLRIFAEKNLSAGNLMQDGINLYCESFQMTTEDIVVMMSDGVAIKSEKDLKKLIDYEGASVKNLARELLIQSFKTESHYDDSTAIAIKMELRK